ncbi:MAG TPA: PPK2 family polyphosphate kinase [Actinocrinis sp.]
MAKSDSKRGADRRPKGGNGTRERTAAKAAKAAKAKPGKAAVNAVAKAAKRGKGGKAGKAAAKPASAVLVEAPRKAAPAPTPAPSPAPAPAPAPEPALQEPAKESKKAEAATKDPKPAAQPGRPPKPPKRKAELLVEQVAAEIVAAELDRELNGGAGGADAGPGEPAQAKAAPVETARIEAVHVKAAPVKAVPVKAAPVEAGESGEKPARTKERAHGADSEPLSALLRYVSVALAGGDSAGAPGQDAVDPASTPGVTSREQAEDELKRLAERLGDLQERLFAAARGGESRRRVLLILQGMDTSGKGGTVRHVVGLLDPNGMQVSSFKAPTEEELAHDFLWRIRQRAPEPGIVGVFDRSQYEDVLIARVRKLALPMVIGRRYLSINKFERELAADGCVVLKCFLHISPEEQKRRLAARLEDPTKHWKYSPTDVDDRALWPQYQDAYRLALEKTSTEPAPWHIVPADRKWYRNYAITRLLVEALEGIDPQYPPGDFDLEVERKRVAES